MCECSCMNKGNIFYVNGEFHWGHYCNNTKQWSLRKLPNPDPEPIAEAYKKLHNL